MKKSELRNIIREEIQLLKEREMYSDNLKKLHLAINQKEYDKAMINVRKEAGWSQSDAEYMLKKYRKDLKYKGSKFYKAPPEIPKEKLKKYLGMKDHIKSGLRICQVTVEQIMLLI